MFLLDWPSFDKQLEVDVVRERIQKCCIEKLLMCVEISFTVGVAKLVAGFEHFTAVLPRIQVFRAVTFCRRLRGSRSCRGTTFVWNVRDDKAGDLASHPWRPEWTHYNCSRARVFLTETFVCCCARVLMATNILECWKAEVMFGVYFLTLNRFIPEDWFTFNEILPVFNRRHYLTRRTLIVSDFESAYHRRG